MPMNYAYHPGNVAHSSAQEVADTVLPAVKTLGINLIPLDGAKNSNFIRPLPSGSIF